MLEVAVRKGSLAIETVPLLSAPNLFRDLGGVIKPNAHVKLPDGRTLNVTAERDVLRDDTVIEVEVEQALVNANRELIRRFEAKSRTMAKRAGS